MEDERKKLNENELTDVSGGSHLSADEVNVLRYRQKLMIESAMGIDLAEAEYLGESRDPGFGFLQCRVRVTKVISEAGFFYMGEEEYRVGDELYVSRLHLDLRERA